MGLVCLQLLVALLTNVVTLNINSIRVSILFLSYSSGLNSMLSSPSHVLCVSFPFFHFLFSFLFFPFRMVLINSVNYLFFPALFDFLFY